MIKNDEVLRIFNSNVKMREQIEQYGEIQIGTIFLGENLCEEEYLRLVSTEDKLFLVECDKEGKIDAEKLYFTIKCEHSLNEINIYSFTREIERLVIYNNNLRGGVCWKN